MFQTQKPKIDSAFRIIFVVIASIIVLYLLAYAVGSFVAHIENQKQQQESLQTNE